MWVKGAKKIPVTCGFCGKSLIRHEGFSAYYCNIKCKSEWQRTQKPVTKEWLYQKYIVEKLDCTQISKIVNRDSKSVWNWMKDFGIPTRPRGVNAKITGFQKGHTLQKGKKLSAERREKLRQDRIKDGRIPAYVNGVHWLKHYNRKPASWKGGITPERQAFYASEEWKEVVKAVWHRDDAFCQRCGKDHRKIDRTKERFHIHHIDSFMNKELRAELSNLVLLCDKCHRWVHGKGNTGRDFLK